jgi:hypothetical protein
MLVGPDWRNPVAYRFTADLNQGQWAWEFLRRNGDYQQDWNWFISTWRGLETNYGAPPERDFLRWKQDPRAYRDAADIERNNDSTPHCASTDDGNLVFIECWMGAKWGFLKFPPDPSCDTVSLTEPVTWRQVETNVQIAGTDEFRSSNHDGAVGLQFDLTLPLKAQLDAARVYLIAEQRRRQQDHTLRLRTIAGNMQRWTRLLRLLNAEAAGASTEHIADLLFVDHSDPRAAISAARNEAHDLLNGGYRQITVLPMKTA